MSAQDWLARALKRAGVLSPDEVEPAIRAGRVRVGRRVVREPLAPVEPNAELQLDGRRIDLSHVTHVLMFHKVKGTLSTRQDELKRRTVFDDLRAVLPESLLRFDWHAVGRLDVDTTGLLLFTNEERFIAHASSPEAKVQKRYVAEVQGHPTQELMARLRQGVTLTDGPARAVAAELRSPTTVVLTLTEGRNHQVKRMLGEVGFPVRALHREAIGRVVLDVPPGVYRELKDSEIREGLGYTPGYPESTPR